MLIAPLGSAWGLLEAPRKLKSPGEHEQDQTDYRADDPTDRDARRRPRMESNSCGPSAWPAPAAPHAGRGAWSSNVYREDPRGPRAQGHGPDGQDEGGRQARHAE